MRTQVASGVSQRKVKWFPASLNKSYKAFWKALVLKREVLNLYFIPVNIQLLEKTRLTFPVQCTPWSCGIVEWTALFWFGCFERSLLFPSGGVPVLILFPPPSWPPLSWQWPSAWAGCSGNPPFFFWSTRDWAKHHPSADPGFSGHWTNFSRLLLNPTGMKIGFNYSDIIHRIKNKEKSFQIILPSDVIIALRFVFVSARNRAKWSPEAGGGEETVLSV